MDHNEHDIDLIILDDDGDRINNSIMEIHEIIIDSDDDECSIVKSKSINLKDNQINKLNETINIIQQNSKINNLSNLNENSSYNNIDNNVDYNKDNINDSLNSHLNDSSIMDCDQENSKINSIDSLNIEKDKILNNELDSKLIELNLNKEEIKSNNQLFLEDIIGLKRYQSDDTNENQTANLNKLKDNENLIDNLDDKETNIDLNNSEKLNDLESKDDLDTAQLNDLENNSNSEQLNHLENNSNSEQLNHLENNSSIEVSFSTQESDITDKDQDNVDNSIMTNDKEQSIDKSTVLNMPNRLKRSRKSKLIEMEADYEFISYKKFKKLPIVSSNSIDSLSSESTNLTKRTRGTLVSKTLSNKRHKCLINKDRFCFMCGRLINNKLAGNITSNNKLEFKDYFGIDLVLNDWCSSLICSNCKNQLNKHKNGKLKRKYFIRPVIWNKPKNHPHDCYFCNVKLNDVNTDSKTSKFIECPNTSVIAPIKNVDSDHRYRNNCELSYEEYLNNLISRSESSN